MTQLGNRRFWIVPVKHIDNERLEKLGKDFIIQLWLQAYNEVKDNPSLFRLTDEEKSELNQRNFIFTEYIKSEEEITLKMDFSGNTVPQEWTSVEINKVIFDDKSSPTLIGRAINKIALKYPELVSVHRTNNGKKYMLPIKK